MPHEKLLFRIMETREVGAWRVFFSRPLVAECGHGLVQNDSCGEDLRLRQKRISTLNLSQTAARLRLESFISHHRPSMLDAALADLLGLPALERISPRILHFSCLVFLMFSNSSLTESAD